MATPALTGPPLVKALRQGGYVLVMRHASSPAAPPEKGAADRSNTKLERQLDETGRTTAREMGHALQNLHIPIGEVDTSPTYRARETLRLAGFGNAATVAELDEPGQSMSGQANQPQAVWLRNKASALPRPATNTIIATHAPNIVGAFGDAAESVAAGEALVFRPDGNGGTELVARIRIEDWPALVQP